MSRSSLTSRSFNDVFLSAILATSFMAVSVSGYQFQVGGETGWIVPTGNEPETYNEWASRNRFRVGDTVHFKYEEDDSVLVVTSADYITCNASNPIFKYNDGDTVFEFDRWGYFYFISGEPGHCESGQRIIIDVMHQWYGGGGESPELAPSPAAGGVSGDDRDWLTSDGISLAEGICGASAFVSVIVGIAALFYLILRP